MNCFKLIPALLLTLPACVLDKDLGDTLGDTTAPPVSSTGMTDSGDTTTTGQPGMTDPTVTDPTPTTDMLTSGTTGEVAKLCPNSDPGDFTCSVPYVCGDFPCGDLFDNLDADGCPRAGCYNDEPCPTGQVCFNTAEWGACNATGTFCEDLEGMCLCGQNPNCGDAAYCVPAEIGPPADCFAITDAAACLAAGCSEAPTATPVTLDGDTCVCSEPEAACLWFTQDEWAIEGSPGAFYEIATGKVVVFPGSYIDLPMGWSNCDDMLGPPACACAATCVTP